MQEPKETRSPEGPIKKSAISSVKIERLQGSPYLRVSAVAAPPAEDRRQAPPPVAPSAQAQPRSRVVRKPQPEPEPKVDPRPESFAKPRTKPTPQPRAIPNPAPAPPARKDIKTPFAQSPQTTNRRRPVSPIVKLGLTAASLTVLILVFLIPSAGPDDISDVTPLAASVDPDAARTNPLALARTNVTGNVTAKPKTVNDEPTTLTARTPVAAVTPLQPALQRAPAPQVTDYGQNDFLAKLTADTVAALRQGADTNSADIYREVELALAHGLSEQEIDADLNERLRANTLSVPAELIKPDGRVDTARVLQNLSRK